MSNCFGYYLFPSGDIVGVSYQLDPCIPDEGTLYWAVNATMYQCYKGIRWETRSDVETINKIKATLLLCGVIVDSPTNFSATP